jgi:hypothetical protein
VVSLVDDKDPDSTVPYEHLMFFADRLRPSPAVINALGDANNFGVSFVIVRSLLIRNHVVECYK